MKKLLYIIGVVLLTSCYTTQKSVSDVTHERVHDTIRLVDHQRDSIYLKDSVFVKEYLQGDTVHQVEYRWRTAYRDRVKTDTVYIRRDSIRTQVKAEVSVKTPTMSLAQKMKDIALLFVIIGIVYYAVHLYRIKDNK